MRITQLQRPLAAAASGCLARRSTASPTTITIGQLQEALGVLRIGGASSNAAVEGRRYASVKSQGAYKLRDTSTIPKKLGAKKSGDSYVIPGNIIYKQRGTIWFPGENCGMGRDHTIFSLATGYVKYYRDPARHPKRQYIGVVFDKADVLPYQRHAARKRKLGMTASPIPPPQPEPKLSPSGIPTQVIRRGLEKSRKPHPRDVRILKLDNGVPGQSGGSSYAYREENWRLGTLVRTEKRKMGSRRVAMRHRRRKVKAISKEMRAEREDKIARRKEALDAQRTARMRKMRDYIKRRKEEKAEEAAKAKKAEAAHAEASSPKGAEMPPPPPPPPKTEV